MVKQSNIIFSKIKKHSSYSPKNNEEVINLKTKKIIKINDNIFVDDKDIIPLRTNRVENEEKKNWLDWNNKEIIIIFDDYNNKKLT